MRIGGGLESLATKGRPIFIKLSLGTVSEQGRFSVHSVAQSRRTGRGVWNEFFPLAVYTRPCPLNRFIPSSAVRTPGTHLVVVEWS